MNPEANTLSAFYVNTDGRLAILDSETGEEIVTSVVEANDKLYFVVVPSDSL